LSALATSTCLYTNVYVIQRVGVKYINFTCVRLSGHYIARGEAY